MSPGVKWLTSTHCFVSRRATCAQPEARCPGKMAFTLLVSQGTGPVGSSDDAQAGFPRKREASSLKFRAGSRG